MLKGYDDLKKTVRKLLTVLIVLIICSLCSCTSKENLLFDLNYEVKEPKNFTIITEQTKYNHDIKTISYSILNTGSEELAIGTEFELHYKTNDGWKWVGFKKETYFEYLAFILYPGEDKIYQRELEEYFNLPLESGEYRIVQDGYASNVFIID